MTSEGWDTFLAALLHIHGLLCKSFCLVFLPPGNILPTHRCSLRPCQPEGPAQIRPPADNLLPPWFAPPGSGDPTLPGATFAFVLLRLPYGTPHSQDKWLCRFYPTKWLPSTCFLQPLSIHRCDAQLRASVYVLCL